MGQSTHDSRTVTGVGFTSARTAVVHILQNRVGIDHDLMTGCPFDMGNKPNATRILLVLRVVQSLGRRQVKQRLLGHN